MGEPAKADPALIPDFDFGDDNYFKVFYACFPMSGNFQLLHDNFLDSTHTSYLHPGLADNEGDIELVKTPPQTKLGERTIEVTRSFRNFVPGESVARNFCLQMGVAVDRVLTTLAYLPSIHAFLDTFTEPGHPSRILSRQIGYGPVTPADERSCYNFAGMSATFDVTLPMFAELFRTAVGQDQRAIESAQAAYDEGRDHFLEINLRQDALSVRSRRVIAAMVAAEEEAGI
jgi:vanillate O-demethylase monooxygenase subunit